MEFGIDFDYASKMWRQNKKKLSDGMFCYKPKKCNALTKKNKPCKNMTTGEFCIIHQKCN